MLCIAAGLRCLLGVLFFRSQSGHLHVLRAGAGLQLHRGTDREVPLERKVGFHLHLHGDTLGPPAHLAGDAGATLAVDLHDLGEQTGGDDLVAAVDIQEIALPGPGIAYGNGFPFPGQDGAETDERGSQQPLLGGERRSAFTLFAGAAGIEGQSHSIADFLGAPLLVRLGVLAA